MPRALIAGCGYVGEALATRLEMGGWEVWRLARSAREQERSLVADLTVRATLVDLPSGLDAVIHAAGPGGRDEAAYRAVYVDGLANLLAALPDRPGRVVLVGSTGVHGQDDGSWVDERTPAAPARANAEGLLAGERLLAEASIPSTVVRLGGIYGPGRTSLIERVRRGEFRSSGGSIHYTNRIHRDDAAGAIVHLLSLSDPDTVYLGVDDEPSARHEVFSWLAARLGVPFEVPIPTGMPTGKRCSNARLRATGFSFRYPSYREGYAALLEEEGFTAR